MNFTTTLARCTHRDADNVLCWGVIATQDGSMFKGELPCGHGAGEWHVVSGSFNPDYPCDPACVYARESECVCSCGGQNHGLGWAVTPNYSVESFRPGVANSGPAWENWLIKAGREQAIERVQRRHQAARVAAETRFIRTRGLWLVINGVGMAAQAYMDCLYADLWEPWADLEFDIRETLREDREAEHARKVAASAHLGEPGEKLTLTLRLVRVQQFVGAFATKTLHTFTTVDGQVVKWWASGDSEWELEPGFAVGDPEYDALMADWNENHPGRLRYRYEEHDNDDEPGHDARICGFWFALGAELEVACTVKSHGEFRDVKETTVLRVRVPAAKAKRAA